MNTAQFVLGMDELMTLKELADVPEVKRARLTYWRIRNWVFVGLNGHKLPTVRIGGVRYTTVEKVLRFATECPARDHIESQDVGLSEAISPEAEIWHKRLAARLYGGKNGKCRHEKAAK